MYRVPTRPPRRAERLLTSVIVTVVAGAVFVAWMHPAVLNPFNVGWLLDGQDRGQSAVGLAAYLRGGTWPSLHDPLLAAPAGVPLLFTDSIPLLGLVLGPIARLLPPGLQFIGPWLLLCVILQAAFAWALIRPHAPDRLAASLGTALLTLMPVLLNRYGHPSLCAQWLILWALWVHVDERRAQTIVHWMAVLCVAALVHSYLLVMCAAIWASNGLRSVACESRPLQTLAGAAITVAPVILISAANGIFGGPFVSTGSYGAFPMALDALWNPANPGYTALLPSSPDTDARGYEGLQYLGAGLIALTIAAIPLLWWRPADGQAGTMKRLLWLLPAFVAIALVAVGPHPTWRGEILANLDLSPSLRRLLDPVRAAGRLFWPATYTIGFVAVLAALRLKRATLVLAAALALQIVDLSPMLAAIRQTSAAADDPTIFHRTRDPAWGGMVARASSVDFQPADAHVDLALMEEISWRAVIACRPTGFTYAARESVAQRARLAANTASFVRGQIDPTRLYVILDGHVPPSLASRVRYVDGVAIIPPSGVTLRSGNADGTKCRAALH